MNAKNQLQNKIIEDLLKKQYFQIKDNSEKTAIRDELAKKYKVKQVWIKDVVINGYGKEGRKIDNHKILDLISADPGSSVVTKVSEDPAEGFVLNKETSEKIYFVSSAPGQEGIGLLKLRKKMKEIKGMGLLVLNNGNEGPISDAVFNEIQESADENGILTAAVYREGISHKARIKALNLAEIINRICEFCAAYDASDDPWRTNTSQALSARLALEDFARWIEVKVSQRSSNPFTVEISKGSTNAPKVLWICLLPPGQQPSDGVYVSICFDRKGRGLICGFSESVSNPKGLKTIKRSDSELLIDVDGERPGTKFNDSFVNPLEIFKESVEEEKLLSHLVNSLELCSDYIKSNKMTFSQKVAKDEVSPGLFSFSEQQEFQESLKKTGFIFSEALPARFLISLLAKPFVILSGNSGTGKTKIAEQFSSWLCGQKRGGHELVAVGADWTDNRHVLGFVNHLRPNREIESPVYQSTAVLDLILRANENPSFPFFLILDEMNLSHVERYFSDFLSAMESREGVIRLHSEGPPDDEKFRLPRFNNDKASVPRAVAYPHNLFVVGTVNVDETTYMFSPKVLDRAHVIEFQAGPNSIGKFLVNPQALQAIVPAAENASASFLALSKAARGIGTSLLDPLPTTVADGLNKHLKSILAILGRGRFEFAFRTVNELNSYLRVCRQLAKNKTAWDSGMRLSRKDREDGRGNWLSDLDDGILQKILPRLHGSRSRMGNLVGALVFYFATGREADSLKFFPEDGKEDAEKTLTDAIILAADAPEFPRCFRKMQTMARVLVEEQFVSFIC